jgi:acyl-CoA synthetase (AMP-forming)/AMP-acid ligase II
MISHRNVIANILQITYQEKYFRPQDNDTIVGLGLLPMSHIYGLVFITHAHAFRGDSVIVLPKFEFPTMLQAIQDYKIQALYLVRLKSCPGSNCSRIDLS